MSFARGALVHILVTILGAQCGLVEDDADGILLVQVSAAVASGRRSFEVGLKNIEEPSALRNLACPTNSTDIDADHGGCVAVRMEDLTPDAQVSCSLNLAWDGWVLTSGNEHEDRKVSQVRASRNGSSDVICEVPPFPEGAEGPVVLQVTANVTELGSKATLRRTQVPLWYFTSLAASFAQRPYFAANSGELLVRTNASASRGALRLRASAPSGHVLVDAPVSAAARGSFNVSFAGLDPAFNGTVRVELLRAGELLAERLVVLQRVPQRQRGSSAVDHKRRSLLVDGRPFFPIGWFSTYLSFGEKTAMSSLVDMARSGTNSVMLYSLIPGPNASGTFGDRGEAPASPGPLLDAAAALGIKVQVFLLDITRPLSSGSSDGWDLLEKVVLAWRHHPAVLSWYIADDMAGEYLPEVYRRIKQLDPHHIVTMAIAGSGDAYRTKYMEGADVIMVETYPTTVDFAFATMNVFTRWPLEFMPALTCGRAWAQLEDNGVITPEVYRSQLYHALIAGTTGEVWFAYRNAQGWNNPGIALDAAGLQAAQQLLDLAPALTSPVGYSASPLALTVTASATLLGGSSAGETAVRARAFSEETGCVTLLVANGLNKPVKASVFFAYGSAGIFDSLKGTTEALVPFELALPPRRVLVDRGVLTEWLPALGVQAFRLNGTSACAVPELSMGMLEKHNLIFNPSFEQFGAFVSSPLYWDCGTSPLTSSACFTDAGVRLDRRHSGRFVTGLDATAFGIKPSIGWSEGTAPWIGTYDFSIWAQAEVPMLLQVGLGGKAFEEMASMELGDRWSQLRARVNLTRKAAVVLKVNVSGILWLDDARLSLLQVVVENETHSAAQNEAQATPLADTILEGHQSRAGSCRPTSFASFALALTLPLGLAAAHP